MSAPRGRPAGGGSRHAYDVIVLGGQLGGALAGALLAKRGYKVLLIEHDGVGPGYERDGFLLPFAPFLMPQLKTMPAVEATLSELALNTVVQRAFKPQQPLLQLALPRQRIDLPGAGPGPGSSGPDGRGPALKKQLGDAGGSALAAELSALEASLESGQAFFRTLLAGPGLPPEGMIEEWGLRGLVKKLPPEALREGPPLNLQGDAPRLLGELTPFLHYASKLEGPFGGRRPLAQLTHSVGHFPGGREALRQLIVKKLHDLGGEILEVGADGAAVAEAILFDGQKATGIQLLRNDTPFRAQCVVGATDAQALRRLLPDKQKQKGLADLLDLSTLRRFLFTVNWVVRAEALPLGMGDLVLLDTPGLVDPGTTLVQVFPARRVDGQNIKEDPDLRVVCAAAFVPAAIRDGGELHQKETADQLNARLSDLMPFADRKRLSLSVPHLDAGGVRGSRLMPHPTCEVAQPALLGVTGLPIRTPVKNLFLANREVFPALGLDGEAMTALGAARRIQESLKKRDFLNS